MGTRLGFLAQALPATAAADRSAQSAQHVVMGLSFAPRAEISEFFPAATCIFAPALLLCGGLIVYSFLGDQHDDAASAKLLHYDLLLYAVHAFYTLMYAVELSHADWDLVALVLPAVDEGENVRRERAAVAALERVAQPGQLHRHGLFRTHH